MAETRGEEQALVVRQGVSYRQHDNDCPFCKRRGMGTTVAVRVTVIANLSSRRQHLDRVGYDSRRCAR